MARPGSPPLGTPMRVGDIATDHHPLWRGWLTQLGGMFSSSNIATNPTVGASPFTYVNNSSSLMQVHVTGGTVSSVQWGRKNAAGTYVNVTVASATGASVVLSQNDQLIITYTVAPTLTVAPL
jgi:hypothetical protein